MAQAQVSMMTLQQAQVLLAQAGATLLRKTPVSQVYVSQRTNQTFTVFPVRTGVVKVQVMAGCTC